MKGRNSNQLSWLTTVRAVLLFSYIHILRLIVVFVVIVVSKVLLPMFVGIPCTAIDVSAYGTVRTVIAEVTTQLDFSFLPSWQSALKSLIAHECLYLVACQYVALVNGPCEIQLVHIDAAGKSHVSLAFREHSLIQVDPD